MKSVARWFLLLVAAQATLFSLFDYVGGKYELSLANTAWTSGLLAMYYLIGMADRVKVLEAQLRAQAVERHPAKGGQS